MTKANADAKTSRPRSRSGRAPKLRGDTYERELATYLSSALGLTVQRAPLSGGGRSLIGDLRGGSSDLTGLPGLWPEAKRTNRFSPYAALAQADAGRAANRCSDAPIIITRRDRVPTPDSLIVMRLSDWTKLYAAWLHLTGHSTIPDIP